MKAAAVVVEASPLPAAKPDETDVACLQGEICLEVLLGGEGMPRERKAGLGIILLLPREVGDARGGLVVESTVFSKSPLVPAHPEIPDRW